MVFMRILCVFITPTNDLLFPIVLVSTSLFMSSQHVLDARDYHRLDYHSSSPFLIIITIIIINVAVDFRLPYFTII